MMDNPPGIVEYTRVVTAAKEILIAEAEEEGSARTPGKWGRQSKHSIRHVVKTLLSTIVN